MEYDSSKCPMQVDPADGTLLSDFITPMEYRASHAETTWLYDPWTGSRRSDKAIETDPLGYSVVHFSTAFAPVQR